MFSKTTLNIITLTDITFTVFFFSNFINTNHNYFSFKNFNFKRERINNSFPRDYHAFLRLGFPVSKIFELSLSITYENRRDYIC